MQNLKFKCMILCGFILSMSYAFSETTHTWKFWKSWKNSSTEKSSNLTNAETDKVELSFDEMACRPNVLQALSRSYIASLFYLQENGAYPDKTFSYSSGNDLYYLEINARTKGRFLSKKLNPYFVDVETDHSENFKIDINSVPHQVYIRFYDPDRKTFSPYYVYSFEGGEIKSINVGRIDKTFNSKTPRNHKSIDLNCPENHKTEALRDFDSYYYRSLPSGSLKSEAQKRFQGLKREVYGE